MKRKILCVFFLIAFCFSSCDKTSKIEEETGKPYFGNMMKGISVKLDKYRKDSSFTVELLDNNTMDSRRFPSEWYVAEDEFISIAFWPAGFGHGGKYDYNFQFYEIDQKTDKYYLGQFIDMTTQDIVEKYPNTDILNASEYGGTVVFYYNEDKTQMIKFEMADNIVYRVGFGYTYN